MTEPQPSSRTRFSLSGIHHVQLAVPAGVEEACRAFWGDLLGLAEAAKPPALAARGGCWFRAPGLEIHLGVEQDFAPARKAHPALLVHGLDELAQRLEHAGNDVVWDENLAGRRRFHTHDPFGNRLEFLSAD